MKALFIGGTGTISTAISALCVQQGWELYLLNRGNRSAFVPEGAHVITADMGDEAAVQEKLAGMTFDVVAEFIAFTRPQVERDVRLFAGKTKQYFFISSASAYQKPLASPVITESTPLANPFWQVWDVLLLWLALIHGGNGMRTVINDYARGRLRIGSMESALITFRRLVK